MTEIPTYKLVVDWSVNTRVVSWHVVEALALEEEHSAFQVPLPICFFMQTGGQELFAQDQSTMCLNPEPYRPLEGSSYAVMQRWAA